MADAPAEVFLDDVFPDFYEKLGTDFRANLQSGQICVAPILYTYQHQQLWRPDGYDGTQTAATLFKIEAAGQNAYNRRALVSPKLEINEEFPVVRAKKRPVVLVKPFGPEIVGGPGAGGRLNDPLASVLPIYSVVDPAGKARISPELVSRLRKLEFPELFFLPTGPTVFVDSVIKMYRLTNVFQPHLEPTQWKLSAPILRILRAQMVFHLTGELQQDYSDAREQLLHP